METFEDPELRARMMSILAKEYNILQPREGLHVSDLISCLTKTYYNGMNREPHSDLSLLRFSIGFGLERVLIQHEAARLSESLELDGVLLSPDFIIDGIHSELKTTRWQPGKWSDTWIRQIMAYCWATDQQVYNLVVLHIVQPALKAYRLVFTREELEENWKWLMHRKAVLEAHLFLKEPPAPFTWNEEWECRDCPYKLSCDLTASLAKLSKENDDGLDGSEHLGTGENGQDQHSADLSSEDKAL